MGRKKTLKKYSINSKEKRYELLFSSCKKFKISNICLGHHQDDLLENFIIRILRGSGLKGLVSLGKKNKINNINILRPLIDIKKEDLIFVSNYVFNFYVKDPSNENEKFQRIRIRKLLLNLEKEGLDRKKFISTINNLKDSEKVIQFYVNENLKKNSFFLVNKNKSILNTEFFSQPHEIILRSLSDLIKKIGKNHYPVRGKKIEKLMNEIKQKSYLKLTLGGCILKKVKETVIISKEH